MIKIFDNVIKNSFGFYELKDKPTRHELEDYYKNQYYKNGPRAERNYTEEEIKYINNRIKQRHVIIEELNNRRGQLSFLDIGCGEGWALNYFLKEKYKVIGMDYDCTVCEKNNPDCARYLYSGDLYRNIAKLKKRGQKFDIIWIDNVLEHVIDPFRLLLSIRNVARSNCILVIDVPNDFSVIQIDLIKKKLINKPYWVKIPDHISYFNKEGIIKICKESGWNCHKVISDYPIDFNLLNKYTNYYKNTVVGKECHKARVLIDNLLHSISIKKTISFYETLADLGLGRSIIGFFILKS